MGFSSWSVQEEYARDIVKLQASGSIAGRLVAMLAVGGAWLALFVLRTNGVRRTLSRT